MNFVYWWQNCDCVRLGEQDCVVCCLTKRAPFYTFIKHKIEDSYHSNHSGWLAILLCMHQRTIHMCVSVSRAVTSHLPWRLSWLMIPIWNEVYLVVGTNRVSGDARRLPPIFALDVQLVLGSYVSCFHTSYSHQNCDCDCYNYDDETLPLLLPSTCCAEVNVTHSTRCKQQIWLRLFAHARTTLKYNSPLYTSNYTALPLLLRRTSLPTRGSTRIFLFFNYDFHFVFHSFLHSRHTRLVLYSFVWNHWTGIENKTIRKIVSPSFASKTQQLIQNSSFHSSHGFGWPRSTAHSTAHALWSWGCR